MSLKNELRDILFVSYMIIYEINTVIIISDRSRKESGYGYQKCVG